MIDFLHLDEPVIDEASWDKAMVKRPQRDGHARCVDRRPGHLASSGGSRPRIAERDRRRGRHGRPHQRRRQAATVQGPRPDPRGHQRTQVGPPLFESLAVLGPGTDHGPTEVCSGASRMTMLVHPSRSTATQPTAPDQASVCAAKAAALAEGHRRPARRRPCIYVSVTFVKVWQGRGRIMLVPPTRSSCSGQPNTTGARRPLWLPGSSTHWICIVPSSPPSSSSPGAGDRGTASPKRRRVTTGCATRGVPDQAILKEVHGRSTWESLSAVARFLRRKDVHDVVLVSNRAHGERLDQIASEVGLHAHVSPAAGSASLSSLLRETVAVSAGRILGYRRLDHFDR